MCGATRTLYERRNVCGRGGRGKGVSLEWACEGSESERWQTPSGALGRAKEELSER